MVRAYRYILVLLNSREVSNEITVRTGLLSTGGRQRQNKLRGPTARRTVSSATS
jgi:hypothetical protein